MPKRSIHSNQSTVNQQSWPSIQAKVLYRMRKLFKMVHPPIQEVFSSLARFQKDVKSTPFPIFGQRHWPMKKQKISVIDEDKSSVNQSNESNQSNRIGMNESNQNNLPDVKQNQKEQKEANEESKNRVVHDEQQHDSVKDNSPQQKDGVRQVDQHRMDLKHLYHAHKKVSKIFSSIRTKDGKLKPFVPDLSQLQVVVEIDLLNLNQINQFLALLRLNETEYGEFDLQTCHKNFKCVVAKRHWTSISLRDISEQNNHYQPPLVVLQLTDVEPEDVYFDSVDLMRCRFKGMGAVELFLLRQQQQQQEEEQQYQQQVAPLDRPPIVDELLKKDDKFCQPVLLKPRMYKVRIWDTNDLAKRVSFLQLFQRFHQLNLFNSLLKRPADWLSTLNDESDHSESFVSKFIRRRPLLCLGDFELFSSLSPLHLSLAHVQYRSQVKLEIDDRLGQITLERCSDSSFEKEFDLACLPKPDVVIPSFERCPVSNHRRLLWWSVPFHLPHYIKQNPVERVTWICQHYLKQLTQPKFVAATEAVVKEQSLEAYLAATGRKYVDGFVFKI